MISNPKILLTYEQSLDFGQGIAYNLSKVSEYLPNASIVCITKNNEQLTMYNQLIFIDAGRVLENGDPKQLLIDNKSFVYRYVKETDTTCFDLIQKQLSLGEDQSKTKLLIETP